MERQQQQQQQPSERETRHVSGALNHKTQLRQPFGDAASHSQRHKRSSALAPSAPAPGGNLTLPLALPAPAPSIKNASVVDQATSYDPLPTRPLHARGVSRNVSCGVRTHAQLPAVDLKSTPLTTRAN